MGRFSAVILAAGKGKRTGLTYSKVLLPLCGKPIVSWVVDAILALTPDEVILVASPHSREKISEIVGNRATIVVQEEPLGTGHALVCALQRLGKETGTLLVACGDTPLLTDRDFENLLLCHEQDKGAATILTAALPNPSGYGRIVQNKQGHVDRIVEERDADSRVKKIKEINSGTYCFELTKLKEAVASLDNQNDQKEYYLTDCVEWLARHKEKIIPYPIQDIQAALGINTLKELGEARQILNGRLQEKWLDSGVIFTDPASVQLEWNIRIGAETVIHPFTILENGTKIGSNCQIGPFTRISDSEIGDDCVVQNSILTQAVAESSCKIGPFAYLRPGTKLKSGVRVGDFVEIKNSSIGENSKVPHLSYVGDAVIGEKVNIGAGTITCNYDGKGKYQTVIEDGAFIGSNTNLLAPVRVGKNAMTGAGSVVKHDVEAGSVVVGVPARAIKKREVV